MPPDSAFDWSTLIPVASVILGIGFTYLLTEARTRLHEKQTLLLDAERAVLMARASLNVITNVPDAGGDLTPAEQVEFRKELARQAGHRVADCIHEARSALLRAAPYSAKAAEYGDASPSHFLDDAEIIARSLRDSANAFTIRRVKRISG